METHRIEGPLSPVESLDLRSRPTPHAFPQTARWGLDIKKNSSPPPRVKFVLDIPFHRTLSPPERAETASAVSLYFAKLNRRLDESRPDHQVARRVEDGSGVSFRSLF